MTQEEHLLALHEEYINQVTESGCPLWMAQMYSQGPAPEQTVITNQDEHQAEHNKDQKELAKSSDWSPPF